MIGIISMDMCAPFGVYLDGVIVGCYETEAEAEAHFQRLRIGQSKGAI